MPEGFYRDLTKELKALGFSQIKGGKGSHEKWFKLGMDDPLIVPFKLMSRHTANAILKDAGSKKKF